jgi:hypothetical protein
MVQAAIDVTYECLSWLGIFSSVPFCIAFMLKEQEWAKAFPIVYYERLHVS